MSRKEKLKQEAAAWRKLAEWCSNRIANYLCWSIQCWVRGDADSWDVPAPILAPWTGMYRRIESHARLGEYADMEFGPMGLGEVKANSDARVMFCLLMALECEAEAEEVPRGH